MAKESKNSQGVSTDRLIKKSLQETVAVNPHIDAIHFDVSGNHHFNVHEHKSSSKEDKAEPGLYARIDVRNYLDQNGRQVQVKTPIITTKIVETLTREQVLEAKPASDLLL